MQAVDILRDQRVQFSAPFELHEGSMPGVGRGMPRGMIDTALPRELADLGIRHVVMNVGEPFSFRVLGPHALRTAEIRMPDSVEMPAPVSATMRADSSTQRQTVSMFSAIASALMINVYVVF